MAFDKRSACQRLWSRSLHLQSDKQIMSSPPTSQPFPKNIHRNGQQTEEDRSATKDIHDLFRAFGRNPWIGKVAQAVEEKVLDTVSHMRS